MDDAVLIQEPFRTGNLPPIYEEPLPAPDVDDTVMTTEDGKPCTLIRVSKGTEHELFCVPAT